MNVLKASLCLALLAAVGAPQVFAQRTAATQQSSHGTQVYIGGWFEVRYPQGFTASGSMPTSGIEDKFDSARFTSPDGKVTFYVYSPQWNGEPTDIDLEQGEREVAREVKRSSKNTVTYWTITGRNGYTRSYQRTEQHVANTNWVFGIEYADQASYRRYRQQYLRFKESFKQFDYH